MSENTMKKMTQPEPGQMLSNNDAMVAARHAIERIELPGAEATLVHVEPVPRRDGTTPVGVVLWRRADRRPENAFVTHVLCMREDAQPFLEGGHYDLAFTDAVSDFTDRLARERARAGVAPWPKPEGDEKEYRYERDTEKSPLTVRARSLEEAAMRAITDGGLGLDEVLLDYGISDLQEAVKE